jgi:hypothetical protein
MCHFRCFTFSCKKRRRTEDINISTQLRELCIFLMFYVLVYSSSWARVRINSGNTLIPIMLHIFCSVDLIGRETKGLSYILLSLHAIRGLIETAVCNNFMAVGSSVGPDRHSSQLNRKRRVGGRGMIYCIKRWRLRRASIPSAKAGTAQLGASGNSSCWYTVCLLKTPSLHKSQQ